MFEDILPPKEKDGRPRRDRAAGLLVTVLVHALLGLLVYHARFTVKILPFGRQEIRSVVIVPPLTVALPKVVGGRGLADIPGAAPGLSRTETAAPTAAAPEPAAAGTGGGEPGPGPEAGAAAGIPGAGSAVPSLSSRFRESLAIHGKSDLTIPLAPPGTPPGPPGFAAGAPLPDFSRYNRGAYGGGVGGYESGRGRGGGTGPGGPVGGQRVGISIPYKGYDLLPWATGIVDRLQANWVLPSVAEVPDPARIAMIVVIKRTGELDSIEILEGTAVDALDRSALDALRAVLPFPALPADFPGDLLEITFEFVYHD